MRRLFLLPLVAAILAVAVLAFPPQQEERWLVSQTGLVAYSGLSAPAYRITPLPGSSSKVVFASRGEEIHALLAFPEGKGPFPAFVVLPGGNVKKEDEDRGLARDLRSFGFATLTLDQRGIGETGGPFPPLEQQVISLANRNEPAYHKMVADALNGFELLRSLPDVSSDSVYLAGVSMGGRTAVIAAAQEPRVAGVLAVSTGGFLLPANLPETQRLFLTSINPAAYVPSLSPRPLLMIHSAGDTVTLFADAELLFSLAGEPKALFTSADVGHGYYSASHRHFLEQTLPAWDSP